MKFPSRAGIATMLMTAASLARADDGVVQLGVGGVVLGKTDHVAMAREVLDVGCSRIKVSLDFVNESDHDEALDLMFPLPQYPATADPQSNYAGQPEGFGIHVEGKPAHYRLVARATREGKDITPKLRSLGFDDRRIARIPFDHDTGKAGNEADPAIRKLRDAGLADEYGDPDFDIDVAYVWKQVFPAHRTLHVEHAYQPFTAGGTGSGYGEGMTEARVRDYCIAPAQKLRLDAAYARWKHPDAFGLPGTAIDYVLTTANTWKDGIRDFTLRIHAGSDAVVVSTCFPLPLERKPGNVCEAHASNFHPAQDLSVYIGNMKSCPGEHFSEGRPPAAR